MSWYVNLRHWLTEDGLPAPGRAGNNAAYLGQMVAAATAHGREDAFASAIDCSRRPGRKPCDGKIVLYLHSDGVIEWKCDCCEYHGFLSDWQETMWDLSNAKRMPPYEDSLVLDVSEEEYGILRGISTSSIDSQAVIAGALATPDEILLIGDREVFELLAGDITSAVKHEKGRKRRVILNWVYESLEALLSEDAQIEAMQTRNLPIHYN